MKAEELCAAVQDARRYLDHFTRREYAQAFRSYTERFSPVFLKAVRETDGSDQAINALAHQILDGLEEGWKRQHFWNRGAVLVNEKQMIVNYFSPMLLGLTEPLCNRLAEAICAEWERRRPDDPYHMATYAEISGGFRKVILGIDLTNHDFGSHKKSGEKNDEKKPEK